MERARLTLAEAYATYVSDRQHFEPQGNDGTAFAETLLSALVDGLNEDVEMTDREARELTNILAYFIHNSLEEPASEVLSEWRQNAQEMEEARRSALTN